EELLSETEKLTEEDTEKMMKKPKKKKPKPDLVIPGEQIEDMFTPEFETTEEIQLELRKKKHPDDIPEEITHVEISKKQKERKPKDTEVEQPDGEKPHDLLSEVEEVIREDTT